MCYLERRSSTAVRYTDRVRNRRIGRIAVVHGFRKREDVKLAVRKDYHRRVPFSIIVDEEVSP
jgi:hypothetical protein